MLDNVTGLAVTDAGAPVGPLQDYFQYGWGQRTFYQGFQSWGDTASWAGEYAFFFDQPQKYISFEFMVPPGRVYGLAWACVSSGNVILTGAADPTTQVSDLAPFPGSRGHGMGQVVVDLEAENLPNQGCDALYYFDDFPGSTHGAPNRLETYVLVDNLQTTGLNPAPPTQVVPTPQQPDQPVQAGVTLDEGGTVSGSFVGVTEGGAFTVTPTGDGSGQGGGNFAVLGEVYDIEATFNFTSATVCLPYTRQMLEDLDLDVGDLAVLHQEGGAWVPLLPVSFLPAVPPVPEEGQVCGSVTSLSPFAIGIRQSVTAVPFAGVWAYLALAVGLGWIGFERGVRQRLVA